MRGFGIQHPIVPRPPPPPPAILRAVLGTGQSLSTGDVGDPPLSTSNVGHNKRLFDSASVYNISNPLSGTLSLIDLMAPMRSDVYGGGGADTNPYPTNIGGESPEIAMVNQLATLFSGNRYLAGCYGQGGAAMSVIEKGGSGNAYAALLFEVQAAKARTPIDLPGWSFQVDAVMITHGEADSSGTVAYYEAHLLALQSDLQTDVFGYTGQTGVLPLLVWQQNSFPIVGGGPNNTAQAQALAVVGNPTILVPCNPGYGYPTGADRVHDTNVGYRLRGEKGGQVLYEFQKNGRRIALTPNLSGISRVGNVVTVPWNVVFGPLQWDGVSSAPHQSGTTYGDNGSVFGSGHTGWTAGKGFELWSGGYGGTPIAITSCTISGNAVVITGASTPDTVACAMTPDDVTPGTFPGGFPDGRCCLLEDSDPFVGLSGTAQKNRAWAFWQGGL